MLGRTTRPSIWCLQALFFFIISDRLRALQFIFLYYKKESRILQEITKNNNIRCLVDESFVATTQQTSVLKRRLLGFWRVADSLLSKHIYRRKRVGRESVWHQTNHANFLNRLVSCKLNSYCNTKREGNIFITLYFLGFL